MLLRQELSEPAAYNSVLRAVASGATRPKEIAGRTGIERNSLAGYLNTQKIAERPAWHSVTLDDLYSS